MGSIRAAFVLFLLLVVFFFKQKTAYEMRISDWSSDVCSSDLEGHQTLTFDQSPVFGNPIAVLIDPVVCRQLIHRHTGVEGGLTYTGPLPLEFVLRQLVVDEDTLGVSPGEIGRAHV